MGMSIESGRTLYEEAAYVRNVPERTEPVYRA